ncbi:unnamed protein product [Linum tenue]|uniref:Serine aminopeptidase S33 domain-containing protein n=1 Tax=Linum tenue TaxID=586396 RepID=A0AAV0HR54_9ROSI|nr:unnamed protein product [Linum tenue]
MSPAVEEKRVTISNKHGEKLVGVLHDSGSKEIVAVCHGFQSTKDNTNMKKLAKALVKEGISAFRFDFAGNGDSEGTFGYGNYWREADDLHSVVEYFAGKNRVVSVILGHSKGGNVVLLYASKFHDIKTVVNISGRYTPKNGIKERLGDDFLERIKKEGFIDVKDKKGEVLYRVTEESLMDRINTDMHKACQQIDQDCSVLTIHGSADTIVPAGDASEFAKVPVSVSSPCRRRRISALVTSMAQSTQNPVVLQNRVIISNKHGEKLVGLLHDSGSKEIVVLCHGFQSSKDYTAMSNLANALEKEEITAFRFDFAGNGESEGTFAYGNYGREADDLRSVVEHFAGENRVVSVILGHSKGGNVVLLYASKFHDIRNVVNVSGRYDLMRGIEERLGKDFLERIKKEGFIDVKNQAGEVKYRATEEALMDRLNTDMHKACQQIDQDCSVLTIHGSADEIIPVEDALEFAKIIPNHKLHIIEGADHGYSSHQTELASVVLEFIKSRLQLHDKSSTS